jgi:hypothetical protein
MAYERIVNRFAAGLITVEAYVGPRARWQTQQWALNSGARKDHRCAVCKRLVLKGSERMFAPLGSWQNRTNRICVRCVHQELGPPLEGEESP